LSEAARYYKLPADQGDCSGQLNCGCLENGWGVDKNLIEAAKYYKLSADQGNFDAQVYYSNSLMYGRGVEKNLREGVRYYRLSAGGRQSHGSPASKREHKFFSDYVRVF
jgi:TPR repeat protein